MTYYDILSLSVGGMSGKTLAVFATPTFPLCMWFGAEPFVFQVAIQ